MAKNQIFKNYFYVSWLMNYHNMIQVLHLNKSGLRNFEILTTMEYIKTKEIHNYVIDLNK